MRSLRTFSLALLYAGAAAPAAAQSDRPFEIADNSFLVEEAFNQEAGIFQNVLLMQQSRSTREWVLEFTQEWPVVTQRHQLSYTVPVDLERGGVGDVLVNYRLQARMEDAHGPAFSPRVSVVLPTGDSGVKYGVQVNLPVSRQYGDIYLHGNAGGTWLRRGEGTAVANAWTPQLAASVIWRALPLVHAMVETVARREDGSSSVLVAPGVRGAANFGTHQLVVGGAIPVRVEGDPETRLVVYLSYELPFRKGGS